MLVCPDMLGDIHDNIALLVEANAKTIQIYQLTGLTMIAAALLSQL